nr:histidine kinase [Actinomycetota bacterium]
LLSRMARLLAEGTGATRADVWLKVGDELRLEASWPPGPGGSSLEALAMPGDDLPHIPGASRTVAVRHQDATFGALSVSKVANEQLTPTEEKLLADLGHQAGLVLRNLRLTAELVQRLEELKASRQRLLTAQDEARRRLERNLHDGAQQHLVALKVHLTLAEDIADELGEAAEPLLQMLGQLKSQAGEALEELRDLARGIYPPLLAAEGLPAALASQARKAPLPVTVQAEGVGRYSQEIEAAVYFCCLEGIQNVVKYAGSCSVDVRLVGRDGTLEFSISDDGCGFDPATAGRGAGSQNMADRVEALEGDLKVVSAPGHGTTVTGRIPAMPL